MPEKGITSPESEVTDSYELPRGWSISTAPIFYFFLSSSVHYPIASKTHLSPLPAPPAAQPGATPRPVFNVGSGGPTQVLTL